MPCKHSTGMYSRHETSNHHFPTILGNPLVLRPTPQILWGIYFPTKSPVEGTLNESHLHLLGVLSTADFVKEESLDDNIYLLDLRLPYNFHFAVCLEWYLKWIKYIYYSFKILPRFWLAKSTRIIHHNQLLLTKFGRILCLTRKWLQKCSVLAD